MIIIITTILDIIIVSTPNHNPRQAIGASMCWYPQTTTYPITTYKTIPISTPEHYSPALNQKRSKITPSTSSLPLTAPPHPPPLPFPLLATTHHSSHLSPPPSIIIILSSLITHWTRAPPIHAYHHFDHRVRRRLTSSPYRILVVPVLFFFFVYLSGARNVQDFWLDPQDKRTLLARPLSLDPETPLGSFMRRLLWSLSASSPLLFYFFFL